MQKLTKAFFVLIVSLFCVIKITKAEFNPNAPGFHFNVSCTYYDSTPKHTYFVFDYSVKKYNSGIITTEFLVKTTTDNKNFTDIYSTSEETLINSVKPVSKGHFTLSNFLDIVWEEQVTSEEKAESAKKNGSFCPSKVFVVHDTKKDQYKTYMCNGYSEEHKVDTCTEVNDYINGNLKKIVKDPKQAIIYEATYYTNIAIGGQDPDSASDDAKDQQEDLDDKIEDVCNPESPNYDEQKCGVESEISKEELDDYENDIPPSNGPIELTPDPEITIPETKNMCEGIFYKNGVKTEFGKLLESVLKLIRYAAPLLVLALSSVDFLKAMISHNKDELTKATKNSALRLILAIILFFIPFLINYLLILIFGISDPTCGLL